MSEMNEVERDEATPGAKLNEPGVRRNRLIARAKGAAGKALLVWLGTGSLGAAIVAFIIFKLMGC